MIERRQDVLPLLDEYLKTQREWIQQIWVPDPEHWDDKRQSLYWNGIVLGKFREKDPMTIKAFEKGVSDSALKEELCLYYDREIKAIKALANPDILQKKRILALQKQREQLSTQPIDEWIHNHLGWMLEEAAWMSFPQTRVLIYLYHTYYNYDSIRKDPYNADLSALATAYRGIFNKQSQFKSYGLVPIDQDRILLPIKQPRIYDCSLNKTFFTKNIPQHLLEKLSYMKSKGLICDLAVRLMNELGYEGRMYDDYFQEALERGEYFDLANLGSFSISRLYSAEYEDCLWVVIDPGNITFEELCKDFDSTEEMVVTQVLHLEYSYSDEGSIITHLDHEYIFYTIEEYANRMHNPAQKGEAKPRMKSFKIDNSKIPFDYTLENKIKDENGNDLPVQKVPFLYYVLESYFKHKDLLIEYFQRIQ